jgi:hypothetical protein
VLNYNEAMRYVFDSYDKLNGRLSLVCSEYEAFARLQKEFDAYKKAFYDAASKEVLRQTKADLAALIIKMLQCIG